MQVKKQQLEPDMEQLTGSKLGLCLFNLYAEYIMWNARLNELQAGIKIAGRNINNLRYAGLKFNIQKTKIMASGPITSWQIDREIVETVTDFIFLASKIHAEDVLKNSVMHT